MLFRSSRIYSAEPHAESWVAYDEIGRAASPYKPTFVPATPALRAAQKRLSDAPRIDGVLIDLGIPGWLLVDDALKMFEVAYCTAGNALEFGTNRGLSTSIIASALDGRPRPLLSRVRSRGRGRPYLVTVDVDPTAQDEAKGHIDRLGLNDRVRFVLQDATVVAETLIAHRRTFGFCFVDHSHAYEPMAALCRLLPDLVDRGGFVLFHDYLDPRNTRRTRVGESNAEYGVYAAVEETLDKQHFAFFGAYGVCALYRRR